MKEINCIKNISFNCNDVDKFDTYHSINIRCESAFIYKEGIINDIIHATNAALCFNIGEIDLHRNGTVGFMYNLKNNKLNGYFKTFLDGDILYMEYFKKNINFGEKLDHSSDKMYLSRKDN